MLSIEEYTKVNESYSKVLTYKVGIDSGFFSEYNNMILAMLYCLENQIQFRLCSGGTNFNPTKGWNGYFNNFCDTVEDRQSHYRTLDWKYALKLIVKRRDRSAIRSLYPYLSFWKRNLLTQDVFGKCRDKSRYKKLHIIPDLDFRGSTQELCFLLVNLTWKYNATTQRRIDEIVNALSLPSKYVSIHVRRGDKIVESSYYPLNQYFEKLDGNIKDLFVATDDYSVVEDIKSKYTDWNVWTLCSSSERGYSQSSADKENAIEKDRNMITLFATMEILNKSERFVGTYSSNIGMFQGMRKPSICQGIDFDRWLVW